MYKEANRLKLRFPTIKGSLTSEQLWDLDLTTLDSLAVSLEEAYENSKGKSFLTKKTAKDKTIKLQFDIVLDVLQTKADEAQTLSEAKEIKEHNAKIIALIKDKQDESLKGKTVKQLEAMLK